jgi:hypothetical protein
MVAVVTPPEILPGLWQFDVPHPEWTEPEGGEDGWGEVVAWWAISTTRGLLLVDPLVSDWAALDLLVAARGGCAGVVRTIHWHERSVAEAAKRYGVAVWAGGDGLCDGIEACPLERADEFALWLPAQAALLFGDAMIRRENGQLRVCPDSWGQPEGGPARLREILGALARFPVEHVLVSHGPLVLGDGLAALRAAVS